MDEATTRRRAPSPSNTRKFVEADARSTDLLPKSSTSHARRPSTNFLQVREEPEFILHDLAGPYPVQNSPSRPARRPTRYKTLPASGLGRPTRYKTLPAARLGGPPGTKLSQRAPKRRFRPTFRMQGELCTASATNTTSRANNFAHQHPTAPQQRAPLQISHAIRLNRTFNKAQKRCNSNDMNSNFEIAKRELHAKLAKQDWRAAGPGRAPRRRTEPHISDTAPPVWRAPECPKGLAAEPTSSDRGKPGKTRT